MKRNKTILAVALGAILASHAFADDNLTPNLGGKTSATKIDTSNTNTKPIDNNELSKISMQKRKLDQENQVATSELTLLKTQKEIQTLKDDQENGVSMSSKNGMRANEEQQLSEEQGIPQDVGFIYKNDKKAKLTEQNSEVNTILKEFQDLKKSVQEKEKEQQAQAIKPMIAIRSLESVDLDRLSVYGESQKSARLKFIYLVTDGPTQKRISNKVDVKEGAEFKVQGDSYKVIQINTDGLTIQNTISKKNIELTRVQ